MKQLSQSNPSLHKLLPTVRYSVRRLAEFLDMLTVTAASRLIFIFILVFYCLTALLCIWSSEEPSSPHTALLDLSVSVPSNHKTKASTQLKEHHGKLPL